MALQKCGLNINQASRELQPHGTLDFPCAGYASRYTDRPEDAILWHWHDELEIMFIKEGGLRVRVPQMSFELKKGDCLAINSNVLHYAIAAPFCELHSIVFAPGLITGNNETVYAKKYMGPLQSCTSFQGYLWKEDSSMAELFCSAFQALSQENPGYEFIVREMLSKLCLRLYKKFFQDMELVDRGQDLDSLRVRKMLTFIHCNFAKSITLPEIAATAGIGERECLRCFKRTIQLSPMQYLLKYRIMYGAKQLLENPASSISEIAAQSGFDSPSNFSKMFRRFYNCAPRDYIKIHQPDADWE